MRLTGLLGLAMLSGCIPNMEAPPTAAVAPHSTSSTDLDASTDDRPPIAAGPSIRSDRTNGMPQGGESDRVAALPAPRPAWETRPVAADAVVVDPSSHLVKAGDTLSRIADGSGVGVEAIARANGLTPPYAVRAGQRLAIPGGRYHLVRPGQSGIAIARAYQLPWSRIVAANAFPDPYVLRAGQRILIPDVADSARTRAAERAAAFRLDVDAILTGGEPALASNQAPVRPVAGPARVLPTTAAVAPPARLASGGFAWPVDGRVVRRFGPGASGERNDGIKIAVPLATPIHAAADGVVAYAGDGIAALGGLVMVKHGDGWTSIYGHASKLLVRRGQAVRRGQTLALSGETGFADRPEVHFELRRGRIPVDPQGQLPRS